MRSRLASLALAGALFVFGAAAFAAVESTAGWTDSIQVGVVLEAGKWEEAPSGIRCYPVGVKDPAPDACTVTHVFFSFHGSNYQVNFGLESKSDVPFAWEVSIDLDATNPASSYTNLSKDPYDGIPMFPGLDVPGGEVWKSWTVSGLSSWSVCAVSAQGDIPVVKLRGNAKWNMLVGGGVAYGEGTFGIQASDGNLSFPEACPG